MAYVSEWKGVDTVEPKEWTCGHCNKVTGNDRGYHNHERRDWAIVFCPSCARPTFFEGGRQVPGASFGNPVTDVPDDMTKLYNEARNCMTVGAYTAAVLVCRKILMHIAADKGAETANKSFKYYVDYLISANIIPQHFRTWVDKIRGRSNEANHELVVMGTKDAEDILSFTEMLLKVLYEYPARAGAPV